MGGVLFQWDHERYRFNEYDPDALCDGLDDGDDGADSDTDVEDD